jgi:hypothetical protein
MCRIKLCCIMIILLLLVFLVCLANNTNNVSNVCNVRNVNNKQLRINYESKGLPLTTNSNSSIKDTHVPNITIIGSMHGNEPAGHYAINSIVHNNELEKYSNIVNFYLFNDPNEYGRLDNTRNSLWGDLNRLWPHKYNKNVNNENCVYPIRVLLPYVQKADLVIDIHEAVGFNRCERSLGNTIYINKPEVYGLMQGIIDERNALNKNANMDDCNRWDLKTKLPDNSTKLGVPIDQYISTIPNENRTTYILIEIPGQKDVQPLEERVELAKYFIHKIMEKYKLLI